MEHKRLLFVARDFGGAGGGTVISKRNAKVYKMIWGENNVDVYYYPIHPNTVKMLYYRMRFSCIGGLTPKTIKKICLLAKGYDYVHIDDSTLGALAYSLKKSGYKGCVITFYHNVALLYVKRNLLGQLMYPILNYPIKRAEILSANYSDHVLTLTKRDGNYVRKHYNKNAPLTILPSSLQDEFMNINDYILKLPVPRKMLELLFVGTGALYANVNGLKWFIKNVLPYINARLTVVGNYMDKIFPYHTEKLNVKGYVEDLGVFYRKADCVIEPIFEGSGMKTKTAEALMWGKFIIGTNEAFVGYEMPETSILCNTAEDFIKSINNLSSQGVAPYNEQSRHMFLEKYSISSSKKIIGDLLAQNA